MNDVRMREPTPMAAASPRPPVPVADKLGAKTLSRRQALARLGLAAAVAYAAPTVTRLDRQALAGGLPSGFCVPGRPGCRPPGNG